MPVLVNQTISHWSVIFGPDSNMSTTKGWIALKFSTDIYIPLRTNCNHVGDLITSPLAPSSGQNVNLSSSLIYDQIACKINSISISLQLYFVFGADCLMLLLAKL